MSASRPLMWTLIAIADEGTAKMLQIMTLQDCFHDSQMKPTGYISGSIPSSKASTFSAASTIMPP
ncbi:hypothetical protein N0V84_008188 [Fusarium piperis]|uniref:Uncharacterized protein n=1 Tax=Fusarium piperis TaxID=1435070 RepID=A0A9W9BKB7_9HYPO|nr:hypothetical protein N0V84_008188 [Fusarium piperis]